MKLWKLTLFDLEVITRYDGEPYLRRLTVFKCPWFGIFLHKFLSDDDECLHDHPWPFVSIILRSGYWETGGGERAFYPPLSILFRKASWAHRIDLEPDRPLPITLVLCGPVIRKWGFFTKYGWIPWKKYDHRAHCG
jgi:hypothetical protein